MERVINILIVEDDVLDVMDVKRTLDKKKIPYNLNVACNGEKALEILNNHEHAKPDLVLIEFNMPCMNGLELLASIRSKPEFKDLKSFILTTPDEQPDKQAAMELNVSGYLIKPLKLATTKSIDALNLMVDIANFNK